MSVFPSLAGLYRYFVEADAAPEDAVIVELEGRLSDDRDLDADMGALLLHPAEVITTHPLDRGRLADVRRRLARADGDGG